MAPALSPLAVFASVQHVSLPHTAFKYLHFTHDDLLGSAELLPGRMLPGLEGEMGKQGDGETGGSSSIYVAQYKYSQTYK